MQTANSHESCGDSSGMRVAHLAVTEPAQETLRNLGFIMEMKRSLLLGSAASFIAVVGAQAADLPVKAKPVEYVKICTLYGEGYYYIPGSDTCLKFGGYVQADYGWNVSGARTTPFAGTQGAQDRTVSRYSTRHRMHLNVDTRTQTDYGTLRTFGSIHLQNEDGVFSNNAARAF